MQDVFSLGCVLGELFLEGKALFDLSKVRHESLAPLHLHRLCIAAVIYLPCAILRRVCLHGICAFTMDTCAVSLVQSASLPARSAVVQGTGCQSRAIPMLMSSISPEWKRCQGSNG